MSTVWYLVLWFVAGLGALGAGGISHYAQSHFSAYAPRLFDGGKISDLVLNEVLSPQHNLLGEYDEAGWWTFDSWRNYALHAAGWLFIVIVAGVVYWPERVQALAQVCVGAGVVGWTPVFCG